MANYICTQTCSPQATAVVACSRNGNITETNACSAGGSPICGYYPGDNAPQPTCDAINCPTPGVACSAVVKLPLTQSPPATITPQVENGNGRTSSAGAINSATVSTSSQPSSNSATQSPAAKIQVRSNTGKEVGIAIGCLIGGALLATLIFFLLFRRKKRSQGLPSHVSPVTADYSHKGYAMETVTPASSNIIEKYLPQPVEDNKISGEMSNLRDKIKNHAQSYYHTMPIDGSQVNEAVLVDVATVLGTTFQALKNILLDPKTRIAGIRACMAAVMFSRFDGSSSEGTLLPAELSSSATTVRNTNNAAHVKLLSMSKVINGTLYQQRNNVAGDSSGANEAIRSINDIVAPFIQSSDEQRAKNLQGIVRRGSLFAVLLHSQPSMWKFEWANGSDKDIIVKPALVQTVNDEAEVLNPERVFVQEERYNQA